MSMRLCPLLFLRSPSTWCTSSMSSYRKRSLQQPHLPFCTLSSLALRGDSSGLCPRRVAQYAQSPSKGDLLPRTLMCRTIFVASCRSSSFPSLVAKTHFRLFVSLKYLRIFLFVLRIRLCFSVHFLGIHLSRDTLYPQSLTARA